MKKILAVIGTRPEAIKMVPVLYALKKQKTFKVSLCITAQQREMLDEVLSLFEITPEYDLNIMKADQSLYEITAKILLGMQKVLEVYQPDLVLVHGDTTTSTTASLAAFYQKIPVGHVEAGLRTGNIYSPWPEEANRRITAVLAHFHFAPTAKSKENLLNENIPSERIIVTGNTVIDTLFLTLKKIDENQQLKDKIIQKITQVYPLTRGKKFILVTGHRRENFGDTFIHICEAIKKLAHDNPDIDIVYPVHLNPHVQKPVKSILEGIENIYLLTPLSYETFLYLMKESFFILTDSGGIQEEAPSLGKPVLVMRDKTERPEAVAAGSVKIVGTTQTKIYQAAQTLLHNPQEYLNMSHSHNPYGEGKSSKKIVDFIVQNL